MPLWYALVSPCFIGWRILLDRIVLSRQHKLTPKWPTEWQTVMIIIVVLVISRWYPPENHCRCGKSTMHRQFSAWKHVFFQISESMCYSTPGHFSLVWHIRVLRDGQELIDWGAPFFGAKHGNCCIHMHAPHLFTVEFSQRIVSMMCVFSPYIIFFFGRGSRMIKTSPRLCYSLLGPSCISGQVHQLWAIQTCDAGGPAVLVAWIYLFSI